jgi:hypothetical protein
VFPILRAVWFLSLLGVTLAADVNPIGAVESRGGILPADGDASVNWRMAGMLSVGDIPNRTTICATSNR